MRLPQTDSHGAGKLVTINRADDKRTESITISDSDA